MDWGDIDWQRTLRVPPSAVISPQYGPGIYGGTMITVGRGTVPDWLNDIASLPTTPLLPPYTVPSVPGSPGTPGGSVNPSPVVPSAAPAAAGPMDWMSSIFPMILMMMILPNLLGKLRKNDEDE